MLYKKRAGMTIVEMAVATIVFSLFLMGLYAAIDVGLKSWQMGQSSSEIQQSGEMVVQRIISELTMTNIESVFIGNYSISFESAVDKNQFKIDNDSIGNPLWQAHIIYFTFPDPNSSAPVPPEGRTLYRRYEAHIQYDFPSILELNTPLSPTGDKDKEKKLSSGLDRVIFERKNNIIMVNLIYEKNIRKNASVNFSTVTNSNAGNEKFELRTSVEPKN
ncbi:MAG: hypothetical protein ABRQ39_02275 [Candidatus Eremiobacterota bacterium]